MSVPTEMELVVDAGGDVTCIYDEGLDLREIGKLKITRASHVEPDAEGYWWADLGPVGGPVLGPFANRSAALEAEREWLLTRKDAHMPTGTSQAHSARPSEQGPIAPSPSAEM